MLEETEGVTKDGQSRDTDNFGNKTQNEDKTIRIRTLVSQRIQFDGARFL